MKLNLLFVATAIAYGSSVVVAQSYDYEFVTRDLADIEDFDAREFYDVDIDARELYDDELDAREFDIEDFDAREISSPKATPARKPARVDKEAPVPSSISRSQRSPDSPVRKSNKLQTETHTEKASTRVAKKTGKGRHHRKTPKGQIRVKGEGKRTHKKHRKGEGKRAHKSRLGKGGAKRSSKGKQSRIDSEDKPERKTRRKSSIDSEQPRKMRKAVRKAESED